MPMQDMNKEWTDAMLYRKYGLTTNEIAFIESMVRPMPSNNNGDAGGETADE
ncbi:MAG: hypothetical protein V1899_11785 [Planctomycetota bacterium]